MGRGAWGLGPGGQWSGFSTHRIERPPQGDAASLVRGLIGHHAVEGAGFAQRAHGSLVDAWTPDEVADVEKRPVGQGSLEFFTCGGPKTSNESQSQPDDRNRGALLWLL